MGNVRDDEGSDLKSCEMVVGNDIDIIITTHQIIEWLGDKVGDNTDNENITRHLSETCVFSFVNQKYWEHN